MTDAQAVMMLMGLGWVPLAKGETIAKGTGRNRCDKCLEWKPCERVKLSWSEKAELCEKCR